MVEVEDEADGDDEDDEDGGDGGAFSPLPFELFSSFTSSLYMGSSNLMSNLSKGVFPFGVFE